jgi:hypothetical protein
VLTAGSAALIAVLGSDGGGDSDSGAARVRDRPPAEPPHRCAGLHPIGGRPTTFTCEPRRGRSFAIVRVRTGAQIPLRASPAGQLVQQLGSRTEFDSPRS